jgi:hypothetical protein
VWTRIDPAVEERLTEFRELHERLKGCVEFCFLLNQGLSGTEKSALSVAELSDRRKFLRAALAEFASMEDAAIFDANALSQSTPPRMREGPDPRIHVTRLLRHANIHLSASPLSSASRDAIWNGPSGTQEFVYDLLVAKGLETSIRSTRDARMYEPTQLDAMIAWIVAEQDEWGIGHVVLRSAELYASAVLEAV